MSDSGLAEFPFPPPRLMERVGAVLDRPDPNAAYDELGRRCAAVVRRLVPASRLEEGASVLDFGSGAGRTLRHLRTEATAGDFWGCDIDQESIDWLNDHLSPPFQGVVSQPLPPLPFADGKFDVIYAFSVFTHIADAWSQWLVELRRVLKPDGWFIATFLGPEWAPVFDEAASPDDNIGMMVMRPANPWDLGGPMTILAPWWIREHWGRQYHIADLEPNGFMRDLAKRLPTQGLVVMRPKPMTLTAEDLEAPNTSDPAEALGLLHAKRRADIELRNLVEENARLRVELGSALSRSPTEPERSRLKKIRDRLSRRSP
jgi:SAM-dependent methyltransferase